MCLNVDGKLKQYLGEVRRIPLLTSFPQVFWDQEHLNFRHRRKKRLHIYVPACMPVSLGWRAFEKEKYEVFKKDGVLIDQNFKDRVIDNENFDQLEERFSKINDDSYNSNDQRIHQQAIDEILGGPLLTL